MQKLTLLLLALLAAAAALMLRRVPASGYAVTCAHARQAACVVRQDRASGSRASVVTLGEHASAAVRVETSRRGQARVLLYLVEPERAHFAAEFEGSDAGDDAFAAAAALNAGFAHASRATVRVRTAAPALYARLSWAALAVMALLVFGACRATTRARGVPHPARGHRMRSSATSSTPGTTTRAGS